jgi:hypothetical protein
MKQYTHIEIVNAQQKLARPVSDFLNSDSITKIVSGIAKKLDLSPEQKLSVTTIITATLIKLEPESALETNIHQLIHELSNEKTRELAADIRDRVFREAERRERENITDARFDWDESELGPKPTPEDLDRLKRTERDRVRKYKSVSPEEVARLAAEEIRLEQEREDREDAEYEKEQAKAPKGQPLPSLSSAAEKALAAALEAVSELKESEPATPGSPTAPETAQVLSSIPQAPSISVEKLSAPTIERNKAERVAAVLGRGSVSQISVPPPDEPKELPIEPRKRLPDNPIKKVDMYREPFE